MNMNMMSPFPLDSFESPPSSGAMSAMATATSFGSFSPTDASNLMSSMMLDDPEHSPFSSCSPPSGDIAGAAVMNQHTAQVDAWGNPVAVAMDGTVSPKLLKLRPSPAPNSSTESFHDDFLNGGSAEQGASPAEV